MGVTGNGPITTLADSFQQSFESMRIPNDILALRDVSVLGVPSKRQMRETLTKVASLQAILTFRAMYGAERACAQKKLQEYDQRTRAFNKCV